MAKILGRIGIVVLTSSAFVLINCQTASATGDIDATFNTGTGPNDYIYSSAIQPDGKIIVLGPFTSYNGSSRKNIARLNSDGTLDETFGLGDGANIGLSSDIVIQSDGKILVGGDFTSYDGIAIENVARLNVDGSLDTSFSTGDGPSSSVYAIAVQSDGKIIIGGDFSSYAGTGRNRIARLNSDGSLDASFNPGTGADVTIWSIALQSDGKIIIAGDFTTYDGITRNGIARINADGSLDSSFNPGAGANNTIWKGLIQEDGKIIIGGYFTRYDGVDRNRIARINTNGSLDETFNPGTGANNYINSCAIQENGKVIIVGNFTSYNGVEKKYIARLNSNGTLDADFNTGSGPDAIVNSASIQSNGKIFIGGYFNNYAGTMTPYVARILANPYVQIPAVSTEAVSSITTTSAFGNANLSSTGGENPERIIEWGTSSGEYINSCTAGSGPAGNYSCSLFGLAPDTKYYVRARANNSVGIGYGLEKTFQTLPNSVVIDSPGIEDMNNIISSNYAKIDSGNIVATEQVTANVEIVLQSQGVQLSIPALTKITNSDSGNFNFEQFTTENFTTSIFQELPQSIAAIKIGAPNTRLSFSQPVRLVIDVGDSYNGVNMDVLYQNEGDAEWHLQTTCLVSDGKCSFTTDHATKYAVGENLNNSEARKAKIYSWKAYKYEKPENSCIQKLKLTIKGKYFAKNAKVRIGNKKAISVSRKSSKELVAKFCMRDLIDIKTDMRRTISVTNPDTDRERANKKIDLSSVASGW